MKQRMEKPKWAEASPGRVLRDSGSWRWAISQDLGSVRQTPQRPYHKHPRQLKPAYVISVAGNKQGLIYYVFMRHQEESQTQPLCSNTITA